MPLQLWAAIFSISPFSMSLQQSFSNVIRHAAMNGLCVGVLWDQHTFGIRHWCKVGWKGSPANMFGRLYIDALWRWLQGNVARFIPEQKNHTKWFNFISCVSGRQSGRNKFKPCHLLVNSGDCATCVFVNTFCPQFPLCECPPSTFDLVESKLGAKFLGRPQFTPLISPTCTSDSVIYPFLRAIQKC